MEVAELLKKAAAMQASAVYIAAGMPPAFLVNGRQERENASLSPAGTEQLIDEIYRLAGRSPDILRSRLDDDFALSMPETGRFRVNAYLQRGSEAAVIRVIRFGLPDPEKEGIPDSVLDMAEKGKGLLIVAGEAGSGKSTTIACMIDRINHARSGHIVTVEDPIEFTYRHGKCIVSQREIPADVRDFGSGLKSALREKADVIFLSSTPDEDMPAVLAAAETGALLITAMYTSGAAAAIQRFLDTFPDQLRTQVQGRLSQALAGIVCQKLVPGTDGKLVPVFEILKPSPVVRDMIRRGSLSRLEAVMQADDEMATADDSLMRLYSEGRISRQAVLDNCTHYDIVSRRLG